MDNQSVILVRYGEISLKGLNRHVFIDLLVKNIRNTLKHIDGVSVRKIQGRIIVTLPENRAKAAADMLTRVFGIVSISIAAVVPSDMAAIEEAVLIEARKRPFETFRVSAKRGNKKFPMKSPDIARHLGGTVLKNIPVIIGYRYSHRFVSFLHYFSYILL